MHNPCTINELHASLGTLVREVLTPLPGWQRHIDAHCRAQGHTNFGGLVEASTWEEAPAWVRRLLEMAAQIRGGSALLSGESQRTRDVRYALQSEAMAREVAEHCAGRFTPSPLVSQILAQYAAGLRVLPSRDHSLT